jgi:DNA-3-methyladenine glycosylase
MLTRDFFQRDSLTLARALLGMVLVHDSPEGACRGRIVEVEAYRGVGDRAAHSFGGRRTPRNEVMYGPAGHAYVYFVYGMHHCVNVVAADVDVPEAVLIRALLPTDGIDLMQRRRATRRVLKVEHLCQGPANLSRAMGIDRRHNGFDLLAGPLRIEAGKPLPDRLVAKVPRVGVAYAGADARRPWRLYERHQPAVSALSARFR